MSNDKLREIIEHLQASHRTLLENQARLLQNVLQLEETLRVYRKAILEKTYAELNHPGPCAMNCTKHTWEDLE